MNSDVMQYEISLNKNEISETYTGSSSLSFALNEQNFLYQVQSEDYSISQHFFQINKVLVSQVNQTHTIVFANPDQLYIPYQTFRQQTSNTFELYVHILFQLLKIIEDKKVSYCYLTEQSIFVHKITNHIKLLKMHSAAIHRSDYNFLHVPDTAPLSADIMSCISSLIHINRLHSNDIYMICKMFMGIHFTKSDFKDTIDEILKYNTLSGNDKMDASAIISYFYSNPDLFIPKLNIKYKKQKIYDKICLILQKTQINLTSVGIDEALEVVSIGCGMYCIFKSHRNEAIAHKAIRKFALINYYFKAGEIGCQLTQEYKIINIYRNVNAPICMINFSNDGTANQLMLSLYKTLLFFKNTGYYHTSLNPFTLLNSNSSVRLPFIDVENSKLTCHEQHVICMKYYPNNDIFTPPELESLKSNTVAHLYIFKSKALIYQICLSYLICLIGMKDKAEKIISTIKVQLCKSKNLEQCIAQYRSYLGSNNALKLELLQALSIDYTKRPSIKRLLKSIKHYYPQFDEK